MTNGNSQGLFVIVAVIIFGIFVLMSYLLFQDRLNVGLSTVFDDSLDTSFSKVSRNNKEDELIGQEEDEYYVYAKIRNGNGSDITDVWIQLYDYGDGTLSIVGSNNTNEDKNYLNTSGNIKGGSLTIPTKVNGKKVSGISMMAFPSSVFTGDLNAPSVTKIDSWSFEKSKFTGKFNVPNVETIGMKSFELSEFTGSFNAPNLKSVGISSFYKAKFDGTFNAPNIETIGSFAFGDSLFTGDFEANKIKKIESGTFGSSLFTGNFIANSLENLDSSFTKSIFKGDFIAPKLIRVDSWTFRDSKFKSVNAPLLSTIGNNSIGMSDGKYYTK